MNRGASEGAYLALFFSGYSPAPGAFFHTPNTTSCVSSCVLFGVYLVAISIQDNGHEDGLEACLCAVFGDSLDSLDSFFFLMCTLIMNDCWILTWGELIMSYVELDEMTIYTPKPRTKEKNS